MNTQNVPFIIINSKSTTAHTSKAGKPYFRQSALFVRGDGASYPLDLMVDQGREHEPGSYALHPRSYKPTRYGVELDPVLGERLDKPAAAKVA